MRNELRKCTRIFLFTLFILSCSQKLPPQKFPILALYGPNEYFADGPAYTKVAQAGFTLNHSPWQDREMNLKALHWADSVGMQLLVSDSRLDSFRIDSSASFDKLDPVIDDYSRHPALFGYYLQNNPAATDFDRLSALIKYFKSKDPSHHVYITLFPPFASSYDLRTSSYAEYLETFLRTVSPSILSIPLYPVTNSGIRPDYYENLELIRRTGKIPFWPVILSIPYDIYPFPEHSHLRVQVYSALACGAQGLQYFAYQTPLDEKINYKDALVTMTGEETSIYKNVQVINREIQKLGPVLMQLTSMGVYHSDPVPQGCDGLPPACSIIKIDGRDMLIGFFKDMNGNSFILLVNKNFRHGARPRIFFSEKIVRVKEVVKNDCLPLVIEWETPVTDKSYSILFKAGDGRLFQLE